ncbi:asialoglycoprotein receptor 1-like [Centropristis striata]|uniref:asialoglycoprotein receptor 1-like n=1 Tax=Centropristis striata TaxID=184440 RepID=UPI0027DF0DC3|nr:asialoglycoprotein receptor 1-like [Centropristis striata]
MSEDIYAKPDLTKKVRFQAGEKEDGNTDDCDDIDSVRIYDNCWAEESTPQDKTQDKTQDNTTEDQQQILTTASLISCLFVSAVSSVSVSPGKRTCLGAAAVFLGLLCLLLLVALIVLLVLLIPQRHQLTREREEMRSLNHNLTTEREEMKRLNHNLTNEREEMRSLNHNLTTERDEMRSLNHNLTTERDEMRSLNHNLTTERDEMKSLNHNLTRERDELQKYIETTCCPDEWMKFAKSCYWMSTSEKVWSNSRRECETRGGHLVIISSLEEQEFISSFNQNVWIGLTDEESEDNWKWVDGSAASTT